MMMSSRLAALSLAMLAAAAGASAQSPAETFTATASVKEGAASATAPVTVTITRYATDNERTAVSKAVKEKGTAGLQQLLTTMKDAGTLELGNRKTPIKFAAQRPTGAGRLVTIVTAEPILFLGAGIPGAKPTTTPSVGVAMLTFEQNGGGLGELAPAAQVALDANGALLIKDYGTSVMWLKGMTAKK